MKKNVVLLLILLIGFLFTFGCVVNENTGVITISNSTSSCISNIKIGDTLIACFIAPGAEFSYYYFTDLNGRLYLTNAEAETGYTGTWALKTGYWFKLYIRYSNGDNLARIACYGKPGYDSTKDTDSYITNHEYYEN